tara:strand:- start:343 stop:675 length:333 start_codon:yes stop_codon:yes gene_type:complete
MSDGCHIWETTDSDWNVIDFTWNEICIAVEVIGDTIGDKGGGYSGQLERLRRRKKEDQKTFIKLICKINGDEFEETKWFRPDVRVKVSDMEIIEKLLTKPEMQVFINKEK